MTLTGDPELFFFEVETEQTLEELLVMAELLVVVEFLLVVEFLVEFLLAVEFLVVAELLLARELPVVVELPVQGPLKGSVFACVPLMTVFCGSAGSKNAVALFAGSWA